MRTKTVKIDNSEKVERLRVLYETDPAAFQRYLRRRVSEVFGLTGTNNEQETNMKTQTSAATAAIDENKIEMTEDHSIFGTILGNRELDEKHVIRLMAKMEEHDLFTPIMVNERLEVIDGQHRLEARRRLKFIVPYYVVAGATLKEVQMLNQGQKNWTIDDFAQSYIKQGNEHYKHYVWFRKRYNLTHTVACMLLMNDRSNTSSLREIFSSGNLRVKNLSEAMKKAAILEQIAPLFSEYASKGFTAAFFYCFEKKSFDVERFLKKLKIYPNLRKCATRDQYITLIEEIYNYHAREQVSLRYSE